jgi:hypothetical protein
LTFQILGIIIPTDELIFVRGVETTNQCSCAVLHLVFAASHSMFDAPSTSWRFNGRLNRKRNGFLGGVMGYDIRFTLW